MKKVWVPTILKSNCADATTAPKLMTILKIEVLGDFYLVSIGVDTREGGFRNRNSGWCHLWMTLYGLLHDGKSNRQRVRAERKYLRLYVIIVFF